eukprot:16435919-Heterocapsa_arctica.AAC.1
MGRSPGVGPRLQDRGRPGRRERNEAGLQASGVEWKRQGPRTQQQRTSSEEPRDGVREKRVAEPRGDELLELEGRVRDDGVAGSSSGQ